ERGCVNSFIAEVNDLIMATALTHKPQNELQKILRDADYFHFADDNYPALCEFLREEWLLTQQKSFTDLEWAKENFLMLTQRHQFYTSFAKTFWQPIKEKNINKIEKRMKKLLNNPGDLNGEKTKKTKDEKPER